MLTTRGQNRAEQSEAELLAKADAFSFRARIDKKTTEGPIFVSAKDSTVTDLAGNEYLDFNSGQICAGLGHSHPAIVAAIKDACDTMIHAHSSYYNVKEIELAARIADIMPAPLRKSCFGESGSDANEMAIMIARKATGGHEVMSPHVSFHGLTDTARSVTFALSHADHGPLAAGSYAMVSPYCYRCPLEKTFPSCELACLKTSFELLDAQSTGQPAAVITEPLFSAGGVIDPPPGWLATLQRYCHARGMLLIVDDEQTGLGKLGSMFGFDRDGVVPDIVTLAKHFGGGIGISAVTTSAAIEDKVVRSGFVATHSHSNDPLICAAGTASIDVVEREDVPAKARAIGAQMLERLNALADRYDLVGDVRGRGMLTGIELVRNRATREPASREGLEIGERCFRAGLIFSMRRGGSVLRFVPPATTTPAQIDWAMTTLEDALEAVSARSSPR